MNEQQNKYCITMDDVFDAKKRTRNEVIVTPLSHFDNLSNLVGAHLYLKLETLQRCKAFKFRGALNKLRTLEPGTTVCAVSAGNHSQGVSLASSICNCKAVIFMPENAPVAKVQATQHYGGTVIQKGASFDEAKSAMETALKENPDWVFVPPYNDPHIIAGTATIGLEIINDLPEVDYVVVPIGGGGLIAGIAFLLKTLKPRVKIIGVNVGSCCVTYEKFNQFKGRDIGKIQKETVTPLADGITVRSPGELNLKIIYDLVDEVVIVSEDEISVSVALLAERAKILSEGAGAVSFAAIYHHKFDFQHDSKIVAVISGGNIALTMLNRCIDRALFLRKTRISCEVVLPYGSIYYSQLLDMFVKRKAEIVSCVSSPHISTPANKNGFCFVLDIENPIILDQIRNDCQSSGWAFKVEETVQSEE